MTPVLKKQRGWRDGSEIEWWLSQAQEAALWDLESIQGYMRRPRLQNKKHPSRQGGIMPLITSLRRQSIYEFEVILVYIVSSRFARATQENPVSTKEKHPQILGPTSLRSQHRLKTQSSPRILEASRARRRLLRRAVLQTEQQLDSQVLPSETTSYTDRETIYKQSCVPLENADKYPCTRLEQDQVKPTNIPLG